MALESSPSIRAAAAPWRAVTLCAALLLSSCDPVLDTVPASKIVIAAAGGATSIEGEAGTLQMSVLDVEPASSNSAISWYVTYGTGMASVSSTGLVTAQVGGTVEVFASDGVAKSNKIPLTIAPQTPGWKVFGPMSGADSREWDAQTAIAPDGTPYLAYVSIDIGKYWETYLTPTVLRFNGTIWEPLGRIGTYLIDSSDADEAEIALEIAADGTPYVAYWIPDARYSDEATSENKHIVARRWSGSKWVGVGGPIECYYAPNYLRLAVSAAGAVYLAYTPDYWTGEMARLSGSTWTEFAPSNANSCYGLVTSPGGDLYAAYSSSGLRVAKYAGSWTPIDGSGVVNAISGGASLAMDSAGTPSVAYGESSGGTVTVRKFAEPANWNPIGATGFTPSAVSTVVLAMSPDDTPHVAYTNYSSARVSVQRFDGTAWSVVGTPDFSPRIFGGPSIAVRAGDLPLVAFTTLNESYNSAGPAMVMIYR